MRTSLAVCSLIVGVFATDSIRLAELQNGQSGVQSRSDTHHVQKSNSVSKKSVSIPLRRFRKLSKRKIVSSEDPDFPNSAAIEQEGGDLLYYVTVKLGDEPGKEFHMLVDNAMASSWIMTSDCTSSGCQGKNLLDVESDGVKVSEDSSFHITYGSLEASGPLGKTRLQLGDAAADVDVGLADTVSDAFADYAFEGILGLAMMPDGHNIDLWFGEESQLPFQWFEEGAISGNAYGIKLSRVADGDVEGELNLGDPNEDLFVDGLKTYDTIENPTGAWELALSGAAAGESKTKLEFPEIDGSTDRSAILDIGTSYLVVPADDAQVIHDQIPGSELDDGGILWKVDCNADTPLFLSFGEEDWRILPQDYLDTEISDSPGKCWSLIRSGTVYEPTQWLVGNVFLKNVYSYYDKLTETVGLGVLKDEDDLEGGSGPSTTRTSGSEPTSTDEPPRSTTDSSSTTTSGGSPGPTETDAGDDRGDGNDIDNVPGDDSDDAAPGARSALVLSSFIAGTVVFAIGIL